MTRSSPREHVNVWCQVVRVTDAAARILVDDDHVKMVWIPLSQLEFPSQAKVSNEIVALSMTTWIATQKGLV